MRGMDWVAKNGLDESRHDPYFMIPSSREGSIGIVKWKDGIYNDFAARMQWSASSKYEEANHHPIVFIGKDKTKRIIEKSVDKGTAVTLDASKSYDPDGNAMSYRWMFYREPSSYDGDIVIDKTSESICEIYIPKESAGKTIHIVLEVTDDGKPALTSYRRIVLYVQ